MLVGGSESFRDRDGSGRRQRGCRGTEAAGDSKGIGVRDGSGEPLFVVLSESWTAAVSGAAEASFYLWFLPGSMGGDVRFGSAVKWSAAARASASSGNNVGGSKVVSVGDSIG